LKVFNRSKNLRLNRKFYQTLELLKNEISRKLFGVYCKRSQAFGFSFNAKNGFLKKALVTDISFSRTTKRKLKKLTPLLDFELYSLLNQPTCLYSFFLQEI